VSGFSARFVSLFAWNTGCSGITFASARSSPLDAPRARLRSITIAQRRTSAAAICSSQMLPIQGSAACVSSHQYGYVCIRWDEFVTASRAAMVLW
jgi:hypothetical protein